MKKNCSIITLIFVMMVTCNTGLAASGTDYQQSAVVTASDWPPWEEVNANGDISGGISIELVKEMLKRMNIEMKTRNVPFKRALAELETGKSDFMLMIAQSAERSKFMTYTDPIRVDYEKLYYSTDRFPSFEWNEWKELLPYTIGTVRGYDYGDAWQKALKTYNYRNSETANDLENVKLVLLKRRDLTIVLESAIDGILEQLPEAKNKIKCASKPTREIPLCFGLSKKSSLVSRLPEMNITLKQMRQDGTFKRILKDYYQELP